MPRSLLLRAPAHQLRTCPPSCRCYTVAPDADRFFSLLAGTQFLAEGLSNLLLFVASLVSTLEVKLVLQMIAFDMGLLAVGVPLMQMAEQRICTPLVGTIQKKGCNPRQIGGAIIVLIASLPGMITKLVAATCGGGGGGGGGINVGGAFSEVCAKMAILFGRSAASGDMAKPAADAAARGTVQGLPREYKYTLKIL